VIDTFGSDFDTTLAVFEDSCVGPPRGCNDDFRWLPQSRLAVEASAGERFSIVVAGYNSRSTGMYSLSITSATSELCSNGMDDDRDAAVDCQDSDCALDDACFESMCDDGLDNEGDGTADLDDSDCCLDEGVCVERSCDDDIDNDFDNRYDCDDEDCLSDPACIESLCDDGIDNDGDVQFDCEDYDCRTNVACIEALCSDGVDNDDDFSPDCLDFDCRRDPACPGGRPRCRLSSPAPEALVLNCGCRPQSAGIFGIDVTACRLDELSFDPAAETIAVECPGFSVLLWTGCPVDS
jgi:hypothetical protein